MFFARGGARAGGADARGDGASSPKQQLADLTLGSGDLRDAVKLPDGEDLNEWLAVNTVDFFNQINMLYGTISEFCTAEQCPIMSASSKYEYLWADGVTFPKPTRVTAPEYVDYLMNWVQSQLDDESLFPSKIGVPFPKNFIVAVKNILKRLFRVYAHMYHSHAADIMRLGEEAHINTSFKHFVYFVEEFKLVDPKELAPMQPLIDEFARIEAERKQQRASMRANTRSPVAGVAAQ